MDVAFCLLRIHNMYARCMLSAVGTGVLTSSVIVLYLLY